jgi:hypothetical protein
LRSVRRFGDMPNADHLMAAPSPLVAALLTASPTRGEASGSKDPTRPVRRKGALDDSLQVRLPQKCEDLGDGVLDGDDRSVETEVWVDRFLVGG